MQTDARQNDLRAISANIVFWQYILLCETQPELLKSNPSSGITTYIEGWQYSRLYEYTMGCDPLVGATAQA